MASKFLATNKKGSRELFEERTTYKLDAFEVKPGSTTGNEAIKDFWDYDSTYYGRVNLSGRPIVPNSTRLRNLAGSGDNILYALDFVADAWANLKKTANNKINEGCLPIDNRDGTTESYIGPFEPVGAYQSIFKRYKSNMQAYYMRYEKTYLEDMGKYNEVLTFDHFVTSFNYYMFNAINGRLPYTLSTMVLSPYGSVMNTGLAISISDLSAGSDPEKEDDFMNNPRLNFYKNIAQEYGFYIDKNVPWRLVANLKSPALEPYIVKRFPGYTGLDSLFEEYYEPVTSLDVETMKGAMLNFYNAFAARRRFELIETRNGSCKTTVTTRRESISKETMNEMYQNSYWLKLYIKYRNLESTLGYSPEEIVKITKNAQDLEKGVDMDKAIDYIDYKFGGLTSVPRSYTYDSIAASLESSGLSPSEKTEAIQVAAKSENLIVY